MGEVPLSGGRVGAAVQVCVCVCKRESERGGKRGWGGGDYGVTAWFTPW